MKVHIIYVSILNAHQLALNLSCFRTIWGMKKWDQKLHNSQLHRTAVRPLLPVTLSGWGTIPEAEWIIDQFSTRANNFNHVNFGPKAVAQSQEVLALPPPSSHSQLVVRRARVNFCQRLRVCVCVCEQERSLQTLYILYLTLATGLFLLWRGGQRVKIPTRRVRLVAYLAKKHIQAFYQRRWKWSRTHIHTHTHTHTALCRFRLIASISPLRRPKVWSLGEY